MEKTHNKSKGRVSKRYKLPAPDALAAHFGIELGSHSDVIAPELIADRKKYRAEVYAALPRAKPGTYARKTLSKRIGVSTRTAQSYDKLAALVVTERYNREPLLEENLADLPERLEPGTRRNHWLENGTRFTFGKRKGKARRFTPTVQGAQLALESSPTGELWLVTQLTNHYSGGSHELSKHEQCS